MVLFFFINNIKKSIFKKLFYDSSSRNIIYNLNETTVWE